MTVRESRTRLEELVGGRTKAAVLRELRRGSDTLSGVARRIDASKGAVFAALGSLERAGVVERSAGRYAIAAAHGSLVDAIVALDAPPDAPRPSPMEQHRGQWVAVDAQYGVLAADDDPRSLVADIRARGLRPHGIMRVPAHGDPPFEGAQGR